MSQLTEKQEEDQARGNFSKVLARLNPRPLTGKRNQPEPGTGAWLTHSHGPPTSPENVKYRTWRSSQSGEVLWVRGDSGTGKSSLAQLAVRDLQADQKSVVLSFGFDACHGPTANTPAELLQSILGELMLHPRATFGTEAKLAISNFLAHHDELEVCRKDQLPSESTWRAFESLICCQKSCFVVIDALDECICSQDKNTAAPGEDLMRKLIGLTERSNLKLACFSRDEPSLKPLMQNSACITLKPDLVMSDVLTVFLKEYDRDPALPPESRERAKKRVLKTADGSFMWAKVLVQYAKSVKSKEAIDIRLEVCPPRLHDAYERMLLETSRLEDFSEDDTRLRRAVLVLLLGAQSPVTLSMLVDALAISERGDAAARTRLLCKPLVNVSGSRVELCHSSARDFLLGVHPRLTDTLPPITLAESHELLARKCLERLLRDEHDHGPCRVAEVRGQRQAMDRNYDVRLVNLPDEKDSFYSYAAEYWITHLMAIPEPAERLSELAYALLSNLGLGHWTDYLGETGHGHSRLMKAHGHLKKSANVLNYEQQAEAESR
ncbi:hypothetical protein MCOR25_006322 [Pyricularia grisea]|uniref:Nephrocystin 3-like N-terminal domain-containing protein n=1 Tax=Pyricularia grisea TaxID=148305 RepID=A0A6P8BEN2_PYRGI|nr:uncharacterized protein PgNI_03593 [Pyricularia grisea]KAI6362021.1 hypothetical protein MCOR25_006322 [Pyricularia grisea]TLD14245.1 hypothetical protein PgNI_03593 [Pyricularia grisea]